MEYHDFRLCIAEAAKAAGLADYDLYYMKAKAQSFGAFQGQIDGFSLNDSIGVCFRCLVDGKAGYASTERMEPDEAPSLVKAAIQSARYVETADPEYLPREGGVLDACEPQREAPTETQMAAILEVERKTLAADERVRTIGGAKLMSGFIEKGVFNSYGVDMTETRQYYGWYVMPVVVEGERVCNEFDYQIERDFDALDADRLVAAAVGKTTARLAAGRVKSGKYRVVLDSGVVTDFLSAFDSVFSSEAAQKGMSLLAGKEGEAIAAPCVTILDDPACPGAVMNPRFDDEGVPTAKKAVVEGGVLKTLLYNLKTAAKAGVATTGNASRASVSARVSVAPTNLYIEPGDRPLEALLASAGDGVFVTDVSGLHAGADAISGDFSLEAKGFRIENGRRGEAVELFTVAGNFYQMLRDVTAVGSDLRFGFPSGNGQVGAPSLLVRELSLSGE